MTRTYSPLYGRASVAAEAEELQAEFERAALDLEDEEDIESKAMHSPTISVEQSAEYLNQTLPAFGITNAVRLRGLESEDAASICNILHILIHQRQKEHEYRKVTEEQLVKLRTDVQTLEQAKDRLGHKLDAKERENGSWMVKEKQLKQSHDAAVRKMTVERDTLVKAKAGLSRKCTQLQHEAKRKEMECTKLGERLRGVLADKTKVDARAAKELERAMMRTNGLSNTSIPATPRTGPATARRAAAPGGKMEEDTFKMVVSAYEAKHKELLDENRDIRSSLAALQKEHMELVNARSSYTPPTMLTELLKRGDSELCHSIGDEVRSLNRRVQVVMKSKQGVSGQVKTPLEKDLQDHISKLVQVITEQEQLMGTAVIGLEKSHQQMQEVQEQVNKLAEEIDTARAERKESQRQLQTVIKEREELASQVHGEKAAHAETRDALELVKKKATELHGELGGVKGELGAAKARNLSEYHEQKMILDKERRELDTARQQLDETQAKLQGGYSDLVAKRQEVLGDIARENARLAHAWDQVKSARKEIEAHQGKLKEAWKAVESAKLETGLKADPRPSFQRISSLATATPKFISHEDSQADKGQKQGSGQGPETGNEQETEKGQAENAKDGLTGRPASNPVIKLEFDPLAVPISKKAASNPSQEQSTSQTSSMEGRAQPASSRVSPAKPGRSRSAINAAKAPGSRSPKVHSMVFGPKSTPK